MVDFPSLLLDDKMHLGFSSAHCRWWYLVDLDYFDIFCEQLSMYCSTKTLEITQQLFYT